MNMSFINKIRKLICHRQYINPIVDENIYQSLEHSYSGGSLSESNLIIVTNIPISEDLILKIQKNENVSISVLSIMDCFRQMLQNNFGQTQKSPYFSFFLKDTLL